MELIVMGWLTAVPGHEGHAAYLTPDGRTTGTSSSHGVHVRRPDADRRADAAWKQGRPPEDSELYDLVPWDEVTGWKVQCECGWAGSTWARDAVTLVDSVADPEGALLPDGSTVDEMALQEWEAHMAPLTAADTIREAAQQANDARRHLDDAVQAARSHGLSWADIGRAAGITRQSARERWG